MSLYVLRKSIIDVVYSQKLKEIFIFQIVMATVGSIFDSAYKGDFDLIKDNVEKDPSLIHKKDNNERTLLHWASIGGNYQMVTFLIDQGSEIDAVEEGGGTPLVLAASAGRAEVVKLLINHKADVNHKNSQGHSSLQYAASKGWSEICTALIENDADINIVDIRGATPLHRAASKGNLSVVKYLLSFKDKINVNLCDLYGNTPLHLACEEDRQEEAILLVKNGALLNISNKEKKTPQDLCSPALLRMISLSK